MTEERNECDSGSSLEERLESLLDSFIERFRKGEHPSIAEYTRKHPDLARKILEVFPAATFLGEIDQGETRDLVVSAAPRGSSVIAEGRGRLLGEYRLLREVGRGGMGVVYEAEQENLGRRVAVKVLPFHSLMDGRVLERFHREARAAARLRHPSIVPVFGLGEDNGIHFYAMQFVDGAGLDRIVGEVRRLENRDGSSRAGGGPAGGEGVAAALARRLLGGDTKVTAPERCSSYFHQVARIVKQVAEALAYAHGQGVLHRDIKPSNLMLDSSGNVWVTDFGLAKAEGMEDLTGKGELLGTLRYLAPESLQGTWDRRSDVYSLGITLHELLALEPAFSGENREELLRQISQGKPRSLRTCNPDIPPALETITLKATCRNPAQRYQSASELAEDLGRFLEGHAVARRLPLFDPRLRRFVIAKRVAKVTAAVIALALAVRFMIPLKPLKPQDLLLEDLDGDRRIDMVVANSGDREDSSADSIAIFYNRGKSLFGRPVFVEVGDLPLGLVRTRLHPGGAPQLLFANARSKNVSRLRAASQGSFQEERLVELEGSPSSIAAADLDASGAGDLAVAFYPSNEVLVFWNDGRDRFAQRTAIPVGPAPWFVGLADLNQDGKADLITSNGAYRNQREKNLSVAINRGQRAFDAAVHYDAGDSAMGFATGDFNNDMFSDIALACENEPRVSMFLNARDGTFPSTAAAYALPSRVWSLSSGDVDADGYPDLFGAGEERSACILFNDRRGAFTTAVSLPCGSSPGYVRSADLDGDGQLDLAITNLGSEDVTILLNRGDRRFEEVGAVPLKSWFQR